MMMMMMMMMMMIKITGRFHSHAMTAAGNDKYV
jgi:hypothetical protein